MAPSFPWCQSPNTKRLPNINIVSVQIAALFERSSLNPSDFPAVGAAGADPPVILSLAAELAAPLIRLVE